VRDTTLALAKYNLRTTIWKIARSQIGGMMSTYLAFLILAFVSQARGADPVRSQNVAVSLRKTSGSPSSVELPEEWALFSSD
jgi:hypothetical protein